MHGVAASVWALALLVAVPNVGAFAPSNPIRPAPPVAGPRQNSTVGCTLVNYTSTVDGFNLSYYECLPSGFSNSSAYPLAVFLHGISGTETAWQEGGYLTYYNDSWVPIASAWGYILLILNTRSGDGFFLNSPGTGPQEQDVWDAIHSEQSRHAVSGLYLFGSSMGTMGTYNLAGHNPGLFKGIGVVLSFSDYFEEYEYLLEARNQSYTGSLLAAIDNGTLPNQSATAERLWIELSTPRFAPQNFSGTPMYIVHGGADVESPNNVSLWPYQQANNTVLNSTCLSATSLGEPANCTQPLTVLHALSPSRYDFRYVYERDGMHTTDELNLSDMFAFWAGQAAPGVFWSTASGTPTNPPADLVNFATVPAGCGSIDFGGQSYGYGALASVPNGTYAVSATPCAGRSLSTLSSFGNATYSAATGSAHVTGSAVVIATFVATVPPRYDVNFTADPASCTPLEVNGSSIASGSTVSFLSGSYGIAAPACTAEQFANWSAVGGVEVAAPYQSSTSVIVGGNGAVTANYAAAKPPPPPPPDSYNVTIQVLPSDCGATVTLGGRLYADDAVVSLPPGAYVFGARACPGYAFRAWNFTGDIAINSSTGELNIAGPGELTAEYSANATVPPVANASAATAFGLPVVVVYLGVGAGIIAAAIGSAIVWRRRRGREPGDDASADR
ncbi:MAG: hypothetical protein L3K17_09225 [Thermoplasmata archaeon]|nr:hypothetical protein [Thermoplasmata archaeon]